MTSKMEMDRQAAMGNDCEAYFWGVCNGNKSITDKNSCYNPTHDTCQECQNGRLPDKFFIDESEEMIECDGSYCEEDEMCRRCKGKIQPCPI